MVSLSHEDDHIIIKNAFYFQAGIGLTANIFLHFFHIFTILLDDRPKLSDLITCQPVTWLLLTSFSVPLWCSWCLQISLSH